MPILSKIVAKCALLFLAVLIAAPAVAQPSSVTEKSDVVWTWSKRCNDDYKLGVKVRLEGKVLYRGVLPLCRSNRNAEDGRVKFHFAGGHTFQGEYRTRKTDSIEGDIWQAGGEPDALILGISFDTGRQVLLNALHIAKPEKQASSELDKVLFVTTYPIPDPQFDECTFQPCDPVGVHGSKTNHRANERFWRLTELQAGEHSRHS